MTTMFLSRRSLPRRSAAVAATLLFLAGTQFCLIGALAGLPMGCVGLPSSAQAADASVPPCHRAPAPSQHSKDTRGACGEAGSPCCLSAAPVEGPAVHKSDATSSTALGVLFAAAFAAAPAPARWSPIPDESPPPLAEPPFSSLGRSPPLS